MLIVEPPEICSEMRSGPQEPNCVPDCGLGHRFELTSTPPARMCLSATDIESGVAPTMDELRRI